MIKAIIIDDEPLAASVIQRLLKAYERVEVVTICHDGFQGVKAINEYQPDLVFLDIQMPKITGLEMLELIDEPPPIIFTTAYQEHAIAAFENNAVDYLLKPIEPTRFESAMDKFLNRQKQAQVPSDPSWLRNEPMQRIVVKDQGDIKLVALHHVRYLEAYDDYVKIYTDKERFVKKGTLKQFEANLPSEQFIRIHRSFIVAVDQITKLTPYEKGGMLAILKNGERLSVSKAGHQRLKQVLGY